MKRLRDLVLFAFCAGVAVTVLMAPGAAADDPKELGRAPGHLPPVPEVHLDAYGRVESYWSCFDFGPYPGVTQKYHHVTNIVLCGNVNLALPPPPGVTPPKNSPVWACSDGPDAIRFTVPFTRPRCMWGSGGGLFPVTRSNAEFDAALAQSAIVKTQRAAGGKVPPITREEKIALLKAYRNGQLRIAEADQKVIYFSALESYTRVATQFITQLTPGVNAVNSARELATGKETFTGKPLGNDDKLWAVLNIATLGISGMSGLKLAATTGKAGQAAKSASTAGKIGQVVKTGATEGGMGFMNAALRKSVAANAAKLKIPSRASRTATQAVVQARDKAAAVTKVVTKTTDGIDRVSNRVTGLKLGVSENIKNSGTGSGSSGTEQ